VKPEPVAAEDALWRSMLLARETTRRASWLVTGMVLALCALAAWWPGLRFPAWLVAVSLVLSDPGRRLLRFAAWRLVARRTRRLAARLPAAEALAFLQPLAADSDSSIRDLAADALRGLGRRGQEAVPAATPAGRGSEPTSLPG
jgi:hypothetical protein